MSTLPLPTAEDQIRIYLRFRTSNVPGEAGRRDKVLTRDFCQQVLGRQLSDTTDFVYVSGLYDQPGQTTYLIFDLNIREPDSDLGDIPLRGYKVTYIGDSA
jgi:hypothetical protein